MKSVAKRAAIALVRVVAPLFYDTTKLKGRWFDDTGTGWRWVLRGIWRQKLLGFNRHLPVPATHTVTVSNFRNLILGADNLNNLQSPGCYFQNFAAKIYIGDACWIGPNVGLITANHDPADPSKHHPGRDIVLGAGCWIGMNSVILPGVVLGPGTVVGAGSVVTKSFEKGGQIIAGNPARLIRDV